MEFKDRKNEKFVFILFGRCCLSAMRSSFLDPVDDCTEVERVDAVEDEGHPRLKQQSDDDEKESRQSIQ
jgi:hypothetical protein